MNRKVLAWTLALGLATAAGAFAVEDGLGTNHVRTIRVYDGIVLQDETKITSWSEVASSTLTNNSIATAMIQDGAVDEDKIAASVAGDGLTGGAGTALAVGQGDGITVTADEIAVDASVLRTGGVQTVSGVKTFTDSPVVPTPTTDFQAATKEYVDGKLSSSVADGTAAHQTLRWDGDAWTNTAGLLSDAAGNVTAGGWLKVTGAQTNVSDLAVGGDVDVTGDLDVTGATTLGAVDITGNITFTGGAVSDLAMGNNNITGLAAPSADDHAATKLYVDSAINGLSWKDAAKAASTGNMARDSDWRAQSVDGVTLAAGDRVLLKDQGTASQNGLYVVSSVNGHLVRADDMNVSAHLAGAAVFVAQGTANAGTAWVCTTPTATLDSGAVTFAQFASPGTYEAGDGLSLTGLRFDVVVADVAGTGLEDDGGNNLRIAAAAAGDGLTGGGGIALAVDPGDGLELSGGKVQVDASVVRTNDAQEIRGVKTFVDSPVVPTPTTDFQAATKLYVDGKLSSSVADGTAAHQTLRWDGDAWTNTAGLLSDAAGNVTAGGWLKVTGAQTNVSDLAVGGDVDVTGDLDVTGTTTVGDISATGNVTLGDAGGDSITFNGTAASALAMGGFGITGLAAPSGANDAATKTYVDDAINGLSWKQVARVASVGNVSIATAPANVDGVALSADDRVLLKDQSTAAENGIYVFASAGAPLVRSADMNTVAERVGAAVFVAEGTHEGTAWVCNDSTIPSFVQFASPGTYTGGKGITVTGLDIAVDATDIAGTGIENDGSGNLRIAAAAVGDGLTGGGGSAITVDASVVRTNGAQEIRGVKTFVDSPVVPTPTTDFQAATKLYVDGKLSSSVADGTAAHQTLRWDGDAWTNSAGLNVTAAGNVSVTGTLGVAAGVTLADTLDVTGKATLSADLDVTGNVDVTGTLDVTAKTTLGDAEVTGDLDVGTDLTVTGVTQLDGKLVTTPTGTTAAPLDVTAGGGIANITRAYSIVRGSGGPVTVTANPRISTTGALPGQMLTLQGGSDANSIKLDDGNGLVLTSGISFTLKDGHIIQFIFDGTNWRETFRTVPAP